MMRTIRKKMLTALLAAVMMLALCVGGLALADDGVLVLDEYESGAYINGTISGEQVQEGSGALKPNAMSGMIPFGKVYETPFDLSGYAGLQMWIWVENADVMATIGDGELEIGNVPEGTPNDPSARGAMESTGEISWQLAGLSLQPGWNLVNFKFDQGTNKNTADRTKINYIAFYWTGTVGGSGFYVDTVSAVTEFEQAEIPACTETGLHIHGFNSDSSWTQGSITTREGMFREGDAALMFAGGLGVAPPVKTVLAEPVDLTGCDAISFWLYVSNAATFNSMADGQLELRSDENAGDADEIHWSLKNIPGLKDGWNYVTFTIESGEKSGAVDLAAINTISLYFVGLTGDPIDTVFDDLHGSYTEGLSIFNFDTPTSGAPEHKLMTGEGEYKEGTASQSMNDLNKNGFIECAVLPEPVDISRFDAVTMWVYCPTADDAQKLGGLEIELISELKDGGRNDDKEISWSVPASAFGEGWTQIVLNFADAKDKKADLTHIEGVGLVRTGVVDMTVYFDDLRAVETKFLDLDAEPIDSVLLFDFDKLQAGVFEGLTLDYDNHKQGYACLTTNGQNTSEVLSASFELGRTGLNLSGENELGLTFWFFVDDAAKLSTVDVELSSSSSPDAYELEWRLSDLQSGWNWITLRASEATRSGGVADLDALCRIRVVAFGADGQTFQLKFDRLSIVNLSVQGALDQPDDSEKVSLDPIDSLLILSCDDKTDTVFADLSFDDQNQKQGYAAAVLAKEQNTTATAVGSATGLSVGKTDLLISDVTSVNELGLTLWFFVEDAAAVESLEIVLSSADFENNTLTWTVTGLQSGWNWITLRASEAEVNGLPDADAFTALRFTVTAAAAEEGYAAFRTLIDRISLVNAAVAENLAQPTEDEAIFRDPINATIIVNCDTVSSTQFTGNTIDRTDYREGLGCVRTEGAGYGLTATYLNVGKTDLTKDTLVLAMWIYIQDAELLQAEGVNGQIELSSSNSFDVNEIFWNVMALDLQTGWNWVVLKGADAEVTGGMPDFDNLCRFRLYINNVAYSTLKLDRITLTNIYDEEGMAEPDWEAEISDDGTFVGPNRTLATNSTYLETVVSGDPIFEEVTTGGCGGSQASAAILLTVAAAAGIILRKRH